MDELAWPRRPPPARGSDRRPAWTGDPQTPLDLALLRRRLRAAAAAGFSPPDGVDDDVEALLLTFEELSSNSLRHGRPPTRVAINLTATGWLIEVSDAAPDRLPIPAIGRDAARGGLGLYLVARLCRGYGWVVEGGRKRVWAHLVCAAGPPGDSLL